ncbi:DUF1223 domain-containing protein [Chitinophagaceae bacterium MMS25-I14]
MKKIKTGKISVLSGALVLTLSAAFLIPKSDTAQTRSDHIAAGNGFAVLELFTSEGCSSCPPADAFLASVQQATAGKPVYALAYHVDYWNRLGWKDIFSDAQYSERQYRYGRQFAGEVYTPQVIINGHTQYVGSDKTAINDGVKKALSEPAAAALTVEVQRKGGNADINYAVAGSTKYDQLVIAVIQKHAVSKVMRGENEGRTLSHVQIVRKLYVSDLKDSKGTDHISLPGSFNPQDWEIIGMVQNQQTGLISAATRASIR